MHYDLLHWTYISVIFLFTIVLLNSGGKFSKTLLIIYDIFGKSFLVVSQGNSILQPTTDKCLKVDQVNNMEIAQMKRDLN